MRDAREEVDWARRPQSKWTAGASEEAEWKDGHAGGQPPTAFRRLRPPAQDWISWGKGKKPF